MNKSAIFISILVLLGQLCYATVTATIDRKTVALGESLRLTIELEKTSQTPDLAPLKQSFDIYNTSTSSQTSIINGKKTSNISYIVTLLPKKSGEQKIPEITVGNDKTLPINLTVTEPSTTDLGGQNSGLFVTAETSSQKAYVNMPILYTLKLYYAENLSDVSMEPITIDHADMSPFGKNVQYQAVQHGKNYQVIEQQFLITAHQPGILTIPAVTIKAEIIHSDFSSFFGTQSTKPVVIKSNPIAIDIKPIPDSIPSDQWLPTTAVQLNSHWSNSSSTLKAGEPITRTVTLTATGTLSANLPDIDFSVPKNSNAYPDKVQTKDFVENHLPAGTKIYKIAYIPTTAGNLTFPKIEVNWWDTATHTLKKAVIPEKTFKVIAGKSPSHQALEKNPSLNNQATTHTEIVYSHLWLYIALALLLTWLLTVFFFIFLLRKRSKPLKDKTIEQKTPQKTNVAIDHKQVLRHLKKACEKKEMENTNQALINWAKLHFHTKIYTIMDIVDNLGHHDNLLKTLIQELNAAIYANADFDGFSQLYQLVESASTTQTKKTQEKPLKSLYPKF